VANTVVAPRAQRFRHEDVEGLRTGRFKFSLSSSCIVYRLGTTVIDTGPPNQWAVVRDFLQDRKVDRVLVTHHHEDHSGNGERLQRELGSTVFVPPSGVVFARDGFPLRAYQRVIWGKPRTFVAEPVPDSLNLGEGFHLRAIHAPGHSPDMTCYLETEHGWLFTGDLYIGSRPRFLRADESVDEQIESLQRVLNLEFETLFCAHRGVVSDGHRALRAKLDYLLALRDEVRHLHGEGRSVGEITRALLGREGVMSLITFYHFSKRNLVRACLTAGDA
jgi:glyoxylase-like metal-dependent hydrolase (beta-lactamase superfamily II)